MCLWVLVGGVRGKGDSPPEKLLCVPTLFSRNASLTWVHLKNPFFKSCASLRLSQNLTVKAHVFNFTAILVSNVLFLSRVAFRGFIPITLVTVTAPDSSPGVRSSGRGQKGLKVLTSRRSVG